MIDKDFIQGCTKEQINAGVAWLEAERLGFDNPCEFMILSGFIFKGNEFAFTPCTNPNDAWSIMMANNIRVFPRPHEPFAKARTCAFPVYVDSKGGNDGLLRAAMEVYILLSVGKS